MSQSNETQIALILKDIKSINEQLRNVDKKQDEILEEVKAQFATKSTTDKLDLRVGFLEKIVYGLVGIVLSSVILAILALVIIQR